MDRGAAMMTDQANDTQAPTFANPTVLKFVFGGLSCMISSFILNPLDVVKVRLQVSPAASAADVSPRAFFRELQAIVHREGGLALGKGLTASMMREASYSSIRMGAYEPIKRLLVPEGQDPGLAKRIAAGLASGAIGAAVANPTDLVKTRFQIAVHPPYRNTFHAFAEIYRKEGGIISGLYRGTGPTVARAAVLTSCQVGTYDYFKHALMDRTTYFKDGIVTHIAASLMASVVTTTAHIPIDVIKSRIMSTRADGIYSGVFDCVRQTFRNEGPRAFFKGFLFAYMRLGPHTVISFILVEHFRKLANINTM